MLTSFADIYHDTKIANLPLYLECLTVDEETGNLKMNIPHHLFPYLVDSGILKVKKAGHEFTNMREAITFHEKYVTEHGDTDEEGEYLDEKQKAKVIKVKYKDEAGKGYTFETALGNAKVGSNTLIINMSSAQECMSLIIGLCPLGATGSCYAIAPELLYPSSMKYRQRQEKQWQCATPDQLAKALVDAIDRAKSIKFVRLNEYGEFRNLPQRPESLKNTPWEKIEYEKIINDPNASPEEITFASQLKNAIKTRGENHPSIRPILVDIGKKYPRPAKPKIKDPNNKTENDVRKEQLYNDKIKQRQEMITAEKRKRGLETDIMAAGEKVVFGDLKSAEKPTSTDIAVPVDVAPVRAIDTGLTEVDDVQKLKTLAAAVAKLGKSVIFYTYTHRSDLFPANQPSKLGDNVILNGSGFMIDNAFVPVPWEEYQRIVDWIEMGSKRPEEIEGGELTDIYKSTIPKNKITECVGDCSICNRCKQRSGDYICVVHHGLGTKSNSLAQQVPKRIAGNVEVKKIIDDMSIPADKKIERIVAVADPKDVELLKYLRRTRADKQEFWDTLLANSILKQKFIDALFKYVKASKLPPNLKAVKPAQIRLLGIKDSVDALFGRLKSQIKKAKAGGHTSSVEEKQKDLKQIITLISNIKAKKLDRSKASIGVDISKKYQDVVKKLEQKPSK